MILVATYLLTFVVPAGEFSRVVVDGRTTVVPNSFAYLNDVPTVHFFDIFVAIPKGLISAAPYLFIVFIAGGLFHILQRTGALENAIGVAVNKAGVKNRNLIITIGTFIYGFFGVAVGFENNIALVPVAVLISAAVGYSSLVGTVMAVGGIGVGFALSPINLYRRCGSRYCRAANFLGRLAACGDGDFLSCIVVLLHLYSRSEDGV
ncbi:arginine/ornithine antiporter ArcD [Vibrio sp. JCM 19052]|nr:arginine/ornithine antiporter ArcD [Vibrio sp. JCM 19052]